MTPPIDAELATAEVPREATQRAFLRGVLLSEHLVFLTAGAYSLWTREEWQALGIGRAAGTAALGFGVVLSLLISLVLAAVTLRCRSPLWVATLAGGVLGPLLSAAAIQATLRLMS
jgi:hypothetical protein